MKGFQEMPELKYEPVPHDHKALLAKARKRKGFAEAYAALELEYQLATRILKARARADSSATPEKS
jgi:hypothetical protein